MDMWIFIGISFPTTQAMKMWIFVGISFRKKIRFIWNSEGHRYLWTLLNYLQKKKKMRHLQGERKHFSLTDFIRIMIK